MHFHSGEQDYETAALERNRLQAVRALLERQRVANEGAGTYDAVAVDVEGTEANAQVFQVRDGVLSDRQSFYLDNEAEQPPAIVAEEFLLQYYASALSIPSLIVVQSVLATGSEIPILEEILAERRGGPVEIRASERGGKRRILELAERNARLALEQEKLKAERRRQQRVESLDGLQKALGLDTLPVRIECFDISHLGGTHTTASMVVFEGGAPKKSDYRRFNIREVDPGDDYAAMAEVLTRRYGQWEKQAERSPYDAERDPSFGALPNLIVIDGGKGQLAAGLEALEGFRDRGVAVISLAKRIEEVFRPGSPAPVGPAARHARAPAAPARARRGAPLRHHAPPDPARPGDDRVDHGRPAGDRPGAQARPAQALRLARRGARRHAARSSSACRGCRRRSPAASTPTSTRRGDERERPRPLPPPGLRDHLRPVRSREVVGHERVRGRRLLLRRQPAGRDDPLAGRAVPPSRLEGRARRGGVGLARRRVPVGAHRRDRRARRGRHRAPRAVPRGRRPDAAQPLQGDAPAAPAGTARQRGGRHRERASS